MRHLYKTSADALFVIHFIVLLTVLFGWFFPEIWYFYMIVLFVTLLSELFWGYCILSKMEFYLRKKINSKLNYDHNWTTFYTYKITQNHISEVFYEKVTAIFFTLSFLINIYFHYFFK